MCSHYLWNKHQKGGRDDKVYDNTFSVVVDGVLDEGGGDDKVYDNTFIIKSLKLIKNNAAGIEKNKPIFNEINNSLEN